MDWSGGDPFASLAHLCSPSDSQEDVFRDSRFAGEPKSDDGSDPFGSERFRVESTGIFMVSPPESLEQEDDGTPHDAYQAAPDESALAGSDGRRSAAVDDHRLEEEVADVEGAKVVIESGCADNAKAVDLGRDTDLGLYSEVQLAQQTGEITRVEESIRIIGVCGSEVSRFEAKNFGLSSDELCREVLLGESKSKRLKLSEEALGLGSCTRTVVGKILIHSAKFGEGSANVPVSSLNYNNGMTEKLLMKTNRGDEDSEGKCSAKRELKFPDEVGTNCKNMTEIIHSKELEEMPSVESLAEKAESRDVKGIDDGKVCNGEFQLVDDGGKYAEKEAGKSVKNSQPDELSKFQETINRHKLCRPLPPSISGVKNNASPSDDCREVTILDILKILKGKEESDVDESFENVSILDIARNRGMTFPVPRWWPDGGFGAEQGK